MSQMGMAHDEHHPQHYHDGTGQWMDGPHSYHGTPQHQSPVHEFNGFTFNPIPMEPIYPQHQYPPRTMHQQLQPLITPQWPSMLTSQSSYVQPIYPTAPGPAPPASTPVSASSTRSGTSSTPRKTLTDLDRRRMCQYHEDHPTVKQTEIGAMFGVERSTVSKVLRQKEKYLYQGEDGSRSPIKRAKGKFPDIERALSNWARNHQKQGLPLTDAAIREKARFFAQTVGNNESSLKANSTSWLEKFKQKNNLGSKSRKNSLAEESEGGSNPGSSAQTPNGISPTSPNGAPSPSPVTLASAKLEEVTKPTSPESYVDFHKPFHSQSNTSLSSVFTDTTTSTYSAGPTSPTSPFFTPDSACAQGHSPFLASQPQQRTASGSAPSGNNGYHRPRSQTFPMLGVEGYASPSTSSEALTPKYLSSTTLDSPISERPQQGFATGTEDAIQHSHALSRTPSGSMQPPPLPNPTVTIPQTQAGAQQHTPISPRSISPSSPSQEDAQRALELVMKFFQQQPNMLVEPQEYLTIGKLMEKLKLQRTPTGENLPGGLHPIHENIGTGDGM
ncbi:CenpB-DNA-bind-domain-containing protein [Pseudovirgaria hyperparasitica]|uniref:CenpB-DNA-bind-domain-containing protein n=1 Tax=Pseudovirgaria hyperparasitica TaxID=470096 RepID=A0A6A6W4H2_9PEZI|nr:CenpB-DNA-bind-domain-containing protein [Pseudovirgaria hyperparasitica]KAF2757828.1 CenpB-DNA-bind-domain-containing protein [Pseudovirgaria hyperparasitica]